MRRETAITVIAGAMVLVTAAVEPAVAQVVHIDPSSGRLLDSPPVVLDVPPPRSVDGAQPAPVIQPAPGGGDMVILDGLFHSHHRAEQNDDGSLTVECEREEP